MPTPDDPLALPRLEDDIHTLFKDWDADPSGTFAVWARFRLIRSIQLEQRLSEHQAARTLIRHMLARLKQESPFLADIMEWRYFKGESVQEISYRSHWSPATTYRKLDQAITQLARLIRAAEMDARRLAASTAQARLPDLPPQQIFGVKNAMSRLSALVHHPESRLILVGGIGGIGKTTLAHALVQQEFLGQAFLDYGWISAQQRAFDVSDSHSPIARPALTASGLIETLTAQLIENHTFFSSAEAAQALEERLRHTPHLIVVDNLETVADVESLLPTLSRLSGASKFLLTSREILRDHPGLHHFLVPELGEADALTLIRYEARRHNLPQVAEAADRDLAPLYAAVGGNPLALRLVAGQLHLLTIDQVVEDLHEARGRSADALYFYIYRRAWMRLAAPAQDTLTLMPLFAQSGADLETLAQLSDLSRGELVESLQTLARLSLVNVTGTLHSRRFSIHRLTESFLRKEIIRWQEEDWEEDWEGDWEGQPQ